MKDHANNTAKFIKQNKMQLFMLCITTIITIANLYIASLLSPLKSDINRVEAIATENKRIIKDLQETANTNAVLLERISSIDKRLERIENRLYQ